MGSNDQKVVFNDRDISWTSFNERVLQEAENKKNPLLERLKFLAIYSSNLEEFYRVRVARQRNFAFVGYNKTNQFGSKPTEILSEVYHRVDEQQQRFGKIFYDQIVGELNRNGYQFIFGRSADERKAALKLYKKISDQVVLNDITEKKNLFLINQEIYLIVVTKELQQHRFHLVQIDQKKLNRFYITRSKNKQLIYFVDDIIREGMSNHFGNKYFGTYAIKISRDADLYLENEPISGTLKEKIKASIKKRKTGAPTRLLVDEMMPYKFVNQLMMQTNSDREAIVPGGRYHSFYDFFKFPKIDNPKLYYKDLPKIPCNFLDQHKDKLEAINKHEVMLAFPYQSYDYIIDIIKAAARDSEVTKIKISLYRVADESKICRWLEKAIKNGKSVTVYTELKARFDETSNIYWNERLKKAGAKIIDEISDLKTHAKIFQIEFASNSSKKSIVHIGTGNFNEQTANVYTDFSFLTSDKRINNEISSVFNFLEGEQPKLKTRVLLSSPYCQRKQIVQMIKNEISHRSNKKKARIILKLNSLEDPGMIKLLYKASEAGVKVDLIIRGICCLVPGVKNMSESIRVYSLVGRFLEHARCFYFLNDGEEKVYLSSADLMTRNLDKRVEIGVPITDRKMKTFLISQLKLQLKDNMYLRKVDHKLRNTRKKLGTGSVTVNAQEEIRDLIKKFL